MITSCNEVTYVIRCDNDIYYVGKTKHLHRRLHDHFNGNGSAVTKTHKPIELVKVWAGNREKEVVTAGRLKYGNSKCFGYCYNLHQHA